MARTARRPTLIELLTGIGIEFWAALAEMAPYLLLGFVVAGFLSIFIPQELVERHLGGRGAWPIAKASLFGVPLPLCSCGVIPVAASLRRHGASRGSTTSFLVSTPQTGVDSILVTYSLLGPVFAIFRPIAALVSGILGGLFVSATTADLERAPSENEADVEPCREACCEEDAGSSRIVRALRYGFVTLPQDLARALLLGLLVAGVIAAVIPDDFFSGWLGSGPLAMLAMLAVGIPIYVCATGTVPVAAALIMKGVAPGAVLVFLMTGPATNAATITTIWRIMGRRTALIYLGVVAASALAAGAILDMFFPTAGALHVEHAHDMGPGWFGHLSAVLLLAVLGYAMWRPRAIGTDAGEDRGTEGATPGAADSIRLGVSGMTCNACARSVHGALSELAGVSSVSVDLDGGIAVVRGHGLDASRLSETVRSLGFDATPR